MPDRSATNPEVITTVAGNGIEGYSGDGGPAIKASLFWPTCVVVTSDGSIYIADAGYNLVRKVGADGVITTVAGNGNVEYSGDGGAATKASLNYPMGVAVASDGSLYIADTYNYVVRKVGADGIITTVAGNGIEGNSGDGGPATRANLVLPAYVAVASDGSVYITDFGSSQVRKVSIATPGFGIGGTLIPAKGGNEIYVFNSSGKHLRTLDPLTGATIYQFTYDISGLLSTITDSDGNTVTIEHDANGDPTSIIAPHGQKTTLSVDANGYLASITNPAGGSNQFTYASDGLMTSMIDPRGNRHHFSYDAYGQLIQDSDPSGGSKNLTRTDSPTGYEVTRVPPA